MEITYGGGGGSVWGGAYMPVQVAGSRELEIAVGQAVLVRKTENQPVQAQFRSPLHRFKHSGVGGV